MTASIAVDELSRFAAGLLAKAGMEADKAETVAEILIEGDLLGHATHGLALLPGYLKALGDGNLTPTGDHETLSDTGACVVWNGRRLPGPWLVSTGIALGLERARRYGSFCLAIRRSHHIACLAAYLRRTTEEGMMIMIGSSDPSVASVAPFGGVRRMITPNPLAAGIPGTVRPILLDISMSVTTNAMVTRCRDEERPLPDDWLLDAEGRPTADPGVFFGDPPGSILPLGGIELGYKGFGLGLLIEAMTSGLAGHGRADPAEGWGASVFVQLYHPAAFGAVRHSCDRWMNWCASRNPDRPRPATTPSACPASANCNGARRSCETLSASTPPLRRRLPNWRKGSASNHPSERGAVARSPQGREGWQSGEVRAPVQSADI